MALICWMGAIRLLADIAKKMPIESDGGGDAIFRDLFWKDGC